MNKNTLDILNDRLHYKRIFLFLLTSLLVIIYVMYMYNFHLNINSVMFILLLILTIIPFFLSNDLMHPFNLFFMSTQFLFIYNMIDLNANKGFLRYGNLPLSYYDTAFWFAILVIVLWYSAMYLGYIFTTKVRLSNKIKVHESMNVSHPVFIAIILITISGLSFLYILSLQGGISGMILAISGRVEAYTGLHYTIRLVGLCTIAAILLLGHGYKKISIIVILVSFFMLSLFGGRGGAFFGSIFPYLIFYHYQIKKIKLAFLVPLGFLIMIFGIALGNYRLYQEARLDISGFNETISSIAHSTQGGEILPSLVGSLISGEMDYFYGSTLINILFAPIPRGLWPDKPAIDESGIIGRALMGADGWGLPPGPYGIAFANFSFLGVAILGFITGIVIYLLYRKFVINRRDVADNNLGLIFYTLTITSFFNIVSTSSQTSILWYVGVFALIKFLDLIVSSLYRNSNFRTKESVVKRGIAND